MRRWHIRSLAALLSMSALTACGSSGSGGGDVTIAPLTGVERRTPGPSADPYLAGKAITAFGDDLYGAVAASAGDSKNVVVSPTSVAMALALLEPGASGAAREQLDHVLRVRDASAYRDAMNALARELESLRADEHVPNGESAGEVTARIANAAYLQTGYPFKQSYVDSITGTFGPVLNEVDFKPDPDAIAHRINAFVADNTANRITDLIGDGVLTPQTVLTLVNALYLKGSWYEPFTSNQTADGPFTRSNGSEVTVPFMHGGGDSSVRGHGFVAASKGIVGGIDVQFILPDHGRFDDIAGDPSAAFAALGHHAGPGGDLVVPRFKTRFSTELSESFRALGLSSIFEPGGLLGVTDDTSLAVSAAIHETYLAIDERGVEAAAATAIGVAGSALDTRRPVPVRLDRPFLLRIVDSNSGATLFLGRIADPTA